MNKLLNLATYDLLEKRQDCKHHIIMIKKRSRQDCRLKIQVVLFAIQSMQGFEGGI